jgi:hypothetical protein
VWKTNIFKAGATDSQHVPTGLAVKGFNQNTLFFALCAPYSSVDKCETQELIRTVFKI